MQQKRATRTNSVVRKKHILKAAAKLSKRVGYRSITRDAVAEVAKVSSPLVATYFPTMEILKKAVMEFAVENEIVEIIVQGLILKDKIALGISKPVKERIAEHLLNI